MKLGAYTLAELATNDPEPATNKRLTATNTVEIATNSLQTLATNREVPLAILTTTQDFAKSDRTLNRRKREDYNAYQRDLMRKRRAK